MTFCIKYNIIINNYKKGNKRKEKYKLTIKLLDEIEYLGIIEKNNSKININSKIDKDNYEYMIKELLTGIGDIKIKEAKNNPRNFIIKQKKFNSLKELFINLKESGFEIEYINLKTN